MSSEKEGVGEPINEGATPESAGSTVAGVAGAATVRTVKVVLPLNGEQRLEEYKRKQEEEEQRLAEMKATFKQAILSNYPSVMVKEGKDELYVSYTYGETADRISIYVDDKTVEKVLDLVKGLVNSVETHEEEWKGN
jgi:L-rhamnose mutarotase